MHWIKIGDNLIPTQLFTVESDPATNSLRVRALSADWIRDDTVLYQTIKAFINGQLPVTYPGYNGVIYDLVAAWNAQKNGVSNPSSTMPIPGPQTALESIPASSPTSITLGVSNAPKTVPISPITRPDIAKIRKKLGIIS